VCVHAGRCKRFALPALRNSLIAVQQSCSLPSHSSASTSPRRASPCVPSGRRLHPHLLAISSLQGAAEFWPWGAGWGTYGDVYPRFQPASIVGSAGYAHHDYVHMLFEAGIFGVILMAAFAVLAIWRAVELIRAVRRHGWRREEMLSAVCGLALLGFLLHSTVEFNMHIPANAIAAALLAGIYLRPGKRDEEDEEASA
jgi:hypothetical protein